MNVKHKKLTWIAAVALTVSVPAMMAQNSATKDIKDAGSDTKHAAEDVGHGVKKGTEKGYDKTKEGTEKGYHKTVHGTKKAYHKTAHATKTGVQKIEGKPNTPSNNPPQ